MVAPPTPGTRPLRCLRRSWRLFARTISLDLSLGTDRISTFIDRYTACQLLSMRIQRVSLVIDFFIVEYASAAFTTSFSSAGDLPRGFLMREPCTRTIDHPRWSAFGVTQVHLEGLRRTYIYGYAIYFRCSCLRLAINEQRLSGIGAVLWSSER